MFAWLASVVGLLALTLSFQAAGRDINKRRQLIYEDHIQEPSLTNILNGVALWSFPMALISTFAFAAINMLFPAN